MTLTDFMRHVEFEPNTGCWLWSGAPGAGGYGVIRHDRRYQKAHRVSWALHNGFMPPRTVKVCHHCDTPACVNPDHLWLGSQADNVADMMAKGRHRSVPRFGDDNPMAALNGDQVWEIRHALRTGKWSQAAIARSYGVSKMTVCRISNWQTWPHIHLNWPFNPQPIYQERAA